MAEHHRHHPIDRAADLIVGEPNGDKGKPDDNG